MKNKTRILVLIVSALLFVTGVIPLKASGDNTNIFRLHILANSNSALDQRTKYLVRDSVLEYESQIQSISDFTDAEATRAILMQNSKILMERIDSVLKTQHADYSAKMYVGTFDFPDRQYGNVFYGAGKYNALRIVLGDGAGENWWCVMFPPLCITEANSGQNGTEEAEENGTSPFSSVFASFVDWIAKLFE